MTKVDELNPGSGGHDQPAGHYVYLYRNHSGSVRYVGYGEGYARAASHQSLSHNEALNAFISTGQYTLEIAGPFLSEQAGRMVETALISATKPDLNRTAGDDRWRFRPFGVPIAFSARLDAPPLTRDDFIGTDAVDQIAPVVFVYINDRNFDDGRIGYDPTRPPSDEDLLLRMDRWWQVASHAEGWMRAPNTGPKTLLAVYGRPGAQTIVAAAHVDPNGWGSCKRDRSLMQIPTHPTPDLDAHRLRGRRISADANIKFGPNRNQVFMILQPDGTVIGGHPSLRR